MNRDSISHVVTRPLWPVLFLAATWTILFLTVSMPIVGARAPVGEMSHSVLHTRLTTWSMARRDPRVASTVDLWTDPALARARVDIQPDGRTVYYRRASAQVWTAAVTQGRSPDRHEYRLAPAQEPSLLTERGVRDFFARLRRRAPAGTVTRVAWRGHPATTFVAGGSMWPFPYAGRLQVWLDDTTGLPLQFRIAAVDGGVRVDYLTVVDRLAAVPSTALTPTFFNPSGAGATRWSGLAQGLARALASLSSVQLRLPGDPAR